MPFLHLKPVYGFLLKGLLMEPHRLSDHTQTHQSAPAAALQCCPVIWCCSTWLLSFSTKEKFIWPWVHRNIK